MVVFISMAENPENSSAKITDTDAYLWQISGKYF